LHFGLAFGGFLVMRIAVTYDNGEVFQHFGHTEEFKVYEVEDGKVVSSEVIDSNGQGHGALANLLAGKQVDVIICGGIGGGAMQALSENNIEVVAGAAGNTDDVVAAYLKGELESTGVNCDHHGEGHTCGDHEEEHSCGHCAGHDEDSSCGGCGDDEEGCGGGCGGCGGCHMEPIMEGKNVGKTCRTHYRGTFNDGTQFDSSYDRGEPLEFVCGVGMMIRGFDAAVANMEVGQKLSIHLSPEEAYGELHPSAIVTMKIAELPGSENLTVGQRVYLQDIYGQPVPVTVKEKDDEKVTFDANHEMAGKELNFDIELVEVIDR
jgi:FKBP-type peptidyl-prolyl cis-trans isomerase 2/predicted Fe-Mo cluster-binding NifX family protein